VEIKHTLGEKGFQLCQSLNVQIQKHPNIKIVQLADKSMATILGSVELGEVAVMAPPQGKIQFSCFLDIVYKE
jgi:hypothetical protein